MQWHRREKFIRLLNAVDRGVPSDRTAAAVVKNDAADKHLKVLSWLRRHPRQGFHLTVDMSTFHMQVNNTTYLVHRFHETGHIVVAAQ